MRILNNKLPLLFILGLMLTGLLINACKKEEQSSLVTFLAGNGTWRLASLRIETLHGDTSKRIDTLNTSCQYNQTFTFNANGSCKYEYYSCLNQVTEGTWQLSTVDSTVLASPMVCKDTTKAGSSRPFGRTQVINLGRNSLVLQSVKTDTFRKTPVVVLRRKITRYGFIH